MRSTYSLDIIINTLCNNDKQSDIIRQVLSDTLALYQWHYQVTDDHQSNRDATSGADKATAKVLELLKAAGEDTLADEVEVALYRDASADTLTRRQVILLAKKYIKEQLFEVGMSYDIYKDKFSKKMERAFIEWCEEYPLEEAPASFDSDF